VLGFEPMTYGSESECATHYTTAPHTASAVEVLKYENSTFRQSHNFISINFEFGVSNYVREVTSPAKFGLDPMSGRDATRGATYTGPVPFYILQQS